MQKRDEEMRKQDTEMKKKLAEAFNIEITDFEPRHARRAKAEPKTDEAEKVLENKNVNNNFWDDIPRVRRARRAEDLGRENVEVVNELKTEAEEPYIIKECKIDSVSLMQDGTIEPCLTDVKFESGNECDLNRDIAEVINEVINEEIHHEYPEEDTESDEFNKEMEADVFPEIAVNNITIGTELSNDVDYSGYEPPEEEVTENHESDNRYNDYNKYNTKHDRRNKKHNKNKKKYNINDDMTDY
jgi:hypothetical protein